MSRVVGVLEDAYYNNARRVIQAGGDGVDFSQYWPDGAETLNSLMSEELAVGGYKYRYSSATATACSPWNRPFEIKIVPRLEMM